MLGLFDSGRGGLNTVKYLIDMNEADDLIYLIDRERAPYGIKTEKEIEEITKRNIDALVGMGARKVLIACCTASTVYERLPKSYKKISVPIVKEVAKEAKKLTRLGSIAVICTKHTAASHAFRNELSGVTVTELDTGELVDMIDRGLSDATVTAADEARIKEIISPILEVGADTLILGCTHFPAIKNTVGKIAGEYGIEYIVDSAKTGADTLVRVKNQADNKERR